MQIKLGKKYKVRHKCNSTICRPYYKDGHIFEPDSARVDYFIKGFNLAGLTYGTNGSGPYIWYKCLVGKDINEFI